MPKSTVDLQYRYLQCIDAHRGGGGGGGGGVKVQKIVT
jgi:hypothetical protein